MAAKPQTATNLQFPSSRRKVIAGHEPEWVKIGETGEYLGYRKGSRGGQWKARYYTVEARNRYSTIGLADDIVEADGMAVLSYGQAVKAAQAWIATVKHADGNGRKLLKLTVANAAEEWLKTFDGRSIRSHQTSAANVKHYILPVLGSIEMTKLTRLHVERWLRTTAATPTIRSKGKKSTVVCYMSDPETQRKRRDSANRVFNDLRALLTHAYRNHGIGDKAAWETVSPLGNASQPRRATLDVEEAGKLLDACEPDFRKMVHAALITGARWGELCHLRVSAFNHHGKLLTIVQEKSGGTKKHVALTEEEAGFIAENVAGKAQDEHIFLREDGEPWKKSDQQWRMEDALAIAKPRERVTFHGLRHSVGRWLAERNLPMAIISKHLGHASSSVTEAFYAHYSPSHVQDTIRANKPSFGGLRLVEKAG